MDELNKRARAYNELAQVYDASKQLIKELKNEI